MYQPKIYKIESWLKRSAVVVALLTVGYLTLHWTQAQEQPQGQTGFVVDMEKVEQETTVHMYAVRIDHTASDAAVRPLFPHGKPTVGQCFGLKAVDAFDSAVGLVYVPQPCFEDVPNNEINTALTLQAHGMKRSVACLAGWCITREETP